MIVLDTNIVIALQNGRPPQVRSRLAAAMGEHSSLAISSVVLFELRYGIAKSVRREVSRLVLERFLDSPVAVLPFDGADAAEAGELRASLERAGTPIGHYDLLIAAQARRRDAMLVTANGREFRRVPGLRTENWAA